MRTVKEVSVLTGISVRTLHWYDEIGLLKPTRTSDAGYRLYDDKALETLQQILFFREFGMPLKEIKIIMENPALDRKQILESQKEMLERKKERLERLISGIDDILKGEDRMNFDIFSQDDIEQLYQSIMNKLTDEQKKQFMQSFASANGSRMKRELLENVADMEEKFHKIFVESASGEQAQKNFQKVVEWYGGKENVLAGTEPVDSQIFAAYQNRLDAIMKKLAVRQGTDVEGFEVKEIIGEYDFVTKQFFQVKDAKSLVKDLASLYVTSEQARTSLDEQYGQGTAEFFSRAVDAFYA